MAEYYNEIDPFCVEWLKNLITAKLIAAGDVDSRSITEVTADDVKGYTQCHFFAGIAGWSYALRLAGVSDDQQVWTGSCPCQPFSNAGKRKGFDDERHLWPEFARLIGDCRPPIVFGEQVEAAIRWGWLDSVFTDLEAKDYTCWAAVLPACGVGAPQNGPRLYFVAAADRTRSHWGTKQDEFKAHGISTSRWSHFDRRSSSPWASAFEVEGADHTRRLLEPGVKLLADGLPAVGAQLRAFGNAIVPQVAAEFIAAAMEYAP